MNLIKDPWLPVVRKDGVKEKIAVHQLLDNYKVNPVMELEAPRPDFKNALYQLLIGIVQVAAMPERERNWKILFSEPYNSEDFSKRVLKYEDCFEIDSEGPAFMQDFKPEDAKPMSLAKLFLDSPSDNALKLNTDHFVKRNTINSIGPYWGAIALYTLQTFTAGIGSGHRVGLRGGGPLSTIIRFDSNHTLWENIWINILSEEFAKDLPGDSVKNQVSDIFPWMKPTKSSKNDIGLFAEECHPFHHYFGMPTRLRLAFETKEGLCNVTGETQNVLITGLKSNTHGNNYSGVWLHPLNAYRDDKKKKETEPLSMKAQPTGIDYRYWSGLIVPFDDVIPAKNIFVSQQSAYRRDIIELNSTVVWAAGYDTDKGKTRNWYESTMPIYPLNPKDTEAVADFVGGLIASAHELSSSLRYAVKSAWFGSPKDAKGDISFLDSAFWQNTESSFYSLLERLVNNLENDDIKNSLVDEWGKALIKEAETLFDSNALAQQEDGLNMKRVIKARRGLNAGIGKMINKLSILKGEEE